MPETKLWTTDERADTHAACGRGASSLSGFTIDTAMPKALFCPTCRNVVLIDNENFPFCSDRCRLLDLGKWASGDYKISSPIQDPDLLEELARSERNKPTDDES